MTLVKGLVQFSFCPRGEGTGQRRCRTGKVPSDVGTVGCTEAKQLPCGEGLAKDCLVKEKSRKTHEADRRVRARPHRHVVHL